jgi:hypothetical protein
MKRTSVRSIAMRWAFAAMGTIGVLSTGVLPASAETMTVSIPFTFKAGTMVMPPGDYVMEIDSKVLSVHGTTAGALVALREGTPGNGTPQLLFDRSAGTAILLKVDMPSGAAYAATPAPKSLKAGLTADGIALSRQ